MAEAENQPTSLYVSNLDTFMTEDLIKGLLSSEKGLTNVKLIRDKTTNALSGYGFLDFTTHADAQAALLKLHGSSLPGSSRILRLNWAQFADRKMPEYSIYVGDLSSEITEQILMDTFARRYPSVIAAKVVTDNAFGHPKGFGFVRFSDEAESLKAIEEMHGTYIGSKPVRVSAASKKDSTTIETDSNVPASAYSYPYYNYGYYDTTSYAGYAGYGAKGQDFSAYFLRYSDVKQDNYQYVTLQMMMIDDEEDHGSLTKFGL